ncbi:MAG: hypothetical protein BWY59_00771 [Verrucomicrobia bacterium ADurb.Bin345]|nr:MAG: hypothetical protein BWY59_00771 [Verrucomicrobia bacterium ADurb.Bin345]
MISRDALLRIERDRLEEAARLAVQEKILARRARVVPIGRGGEEIENALRAFPLPFQHERHGHERIVERVAFVVLGRGEELLRGRRHILKRLQPLEHPRILRDQRRGAALSEPDTRQFTIRIQLRAGDRNVEWTVGPRGTRVPRERGRLPLFPEADIGKQHGARALAGNGQVKLRQARVLAVPAPQVVHVLAVRRDTDPVAETVLQSDLRAVDRSVPVHELHFEVAGRSRFDEERDGNRVGWSLRDNPFELNVAMVPAERVVDLQGLSFRRRRPGHRAGGLVVRSHLPERDFIPILRHQAARKARGAQRAPLQKKAGQETNDECDSVVNDRHGGISPGHQRDCIKPWRRRIAHPATPRNN